MKDVISRSMIVHDKMPVREVRLKKEDFEYLRDYIMHCRYIACQDEGAQPVKTLYLFEAAKTINFAISILSKIDGIAFYDPKLRIDHTLEYAELNVGMRYLDNWHTEEDDCRLTIAFGKDGEFVGYTVYFSRDNTILHMLQYPLYEEDLFKNADAGKPTPIRIFAYDMNFPMPTEFRRIVKMYYSEITNREHFATDPVELFMNDNSNIIF